MYVCMYVYLFIYLFIYRYKKPAKASYGHSGGEAPAGTLHPTWQILDGSYDSPLIPAFCKWTFWEVQGHDPRLWSLPPTWETQTEFQDASSGLAQPWLSQASGEWNSHWESSLTLFLLIWNKSVLKVFKSSYHWSMHWKSGQWLLECQGWFMIHRSPAVSWRLELLPGVAGVCQGSLWQCTAHVLLVCPSPCIHAILHSSLWFWSLNQLL